MVLLEEEADPQTVVALHRDEDVSEVAAVATTSSREVADRVHRQAILGKHVPRIPSKQVASLHSEAVFSRGMISELSLSCL